MIFRERIDIEQDDSEAGDPVPSYDSNFARDVPAHIDSIMGDERHRGPQLEAGIDYVVKMHQTTGVKPNMRVSVNTGVYSGRNLNIKYVQQIPYMNGRPPMTWLYCMENVDV